MPPLATVSVFAPSATVEPATPFSVWICRAPEAAEMSNDVLAPVRSTPAEVWMTPAPDSASVPPEIVVNPV